MRLPLLVFGTALVGLPELAAAADLGLLPPRTRVREELRVERREMSVPPPEVRAFINPGRPTEITYVLHPLREVVVRDEAVIRARY
jgi:hypothetical protein